MRKWGCKERLTKRILLHNISVCGCAMFRAAVFHVSILIFNWIAERVIAPHDKQHLNARTNTHLSASIAHILDAYRNGILRDSPAFLLSCTLHAAHMHFECIPLYISCPNTFGRMYVAFSNSKHLYAYRNILQKHNATPISIYAFSICGAYFKRAFNTTMISIIFEVETISKNANISG